MMEIPNDLKGRWAQAQIDEQKPWHWMQIHPSEMIALIERVATLEAALTPKQKAAEETYEALEAALETWDRCSSGSRPLLTWVVMARYALAKAGQP